MGVSTVSMREVETEGIDITMQFTIHNINSDSLIEYEYTVLIEFERCRSNYAMMHCGVITLSKLFL